MVASMRASVLNSMNYLARQMCIPVPDSKPGMFYLINFISCIGLLFIFFVFIDAAMTPLLEIRLELVPPSIHFVPDFGFIKEMIDTWMDEFLKISLFLVILLHLFDGCHVFSVVRRLDGSDADYVQEILVDNSVSYYMSVLSFLFIYGVV